MRMDHCTLKKSITRLSPSGEYIDISMCRLTGWLSYAYTYVYTAPLGWSPHGNNSPPA